MQLPDNLIADIKSLSTPAVIAISGFGGSGKTSLANSIGLQLKIPVVGVDSFMKPGAFDTYYNLWEIMDFVRLKSEVLEPLINNKEVIKYGHFDVKVNIISETKEIKNTGHIIVEGVGLFRPELLKYFSYKIWIDCSLELAIERGKKRDREEYGNPTDELWEGLWKNNDLECYKKFEPRKVADYVIGATKLSEFQ